MNTSTKADWIIPAALIALSLIPTIAGTLRIVELGIGTEVTPDSARFFGA